MATAVAAANNTVTTSINVQASALMNLTTQYQRLAASRMPGGAPPLRFATGGKVPGTGSTDKVPALLTPGEFVVKKQVSQKNSGFLSALNNGSVKGFNTGGDVSVSTPELGKMRMSSTSGATVDLDIDPSISQLELQDIKTSIEQAIKQGVIDGSQEGLERAKADMDRGLSKVTDGKQSNDKSRSARTDFMSGSGDTGQAMQKPQTEDYDIAYAHAIPGRKVDGREYLADRTKHGDNKATRNMVGFLEGQDLDPNDPELASKIAARQDGIALEQTATNADVQPTWLNAKSKQRPSENNPNPGANARMASKSMLAMHNDPLVPDLSDGTRVAFDRYSNENSLSQADRDKGHAEIDAAEQRIIAKLNEQANTLDDSARWVESSEQKAKETDIAWNDVKAEVENYGGKDSVLGDFNARRNEYGSDTRYATGPKPVSKLAPGMGAISEPGGRLNDSQGKRISHQGTARDLYQGDNWKHDMLKTKLINERKVKMMNAGFTPAEVKNMQVDARKAGVSVADAFKEGLKQVDKNGVDAVRKSGIQMKAAATEVGKDVGEGIVLGIRQEIPAVTAAGGAEAQAAIDGAEDRLQIASPSRVFKRIGKMVTTGFVGGMKEGTPAVKQEGAKLGGAAVQGAETGAKGAAKAGRKFGMGGMGGSQMAQMGVGMGISAMSTMPQMMGKDSIMGVSSEFTMGIGMATGQVASFAAMLGPAGPAVAVLAAAAGAVAFGFKALQGNLEETSDAAAKLGANLGGAANAAATMSKVFGKATAIQNQNNIKLTNEEQEAASDFAAQLQSDEGQELIKTIKDAAGADRLDLMADLIESAVINGMIEADQAGTFAKVLADEVGNSTLAQKVMDRNAEQAKLDNRTERAVSAAEKRDAEINSNKDIGKNGVVGQATTMAASAQALKDWTTVAAVAKDEYAAGIISYEEYIAALNKATVAQRDYSVMLQKSVELGDNAYLTRRSIDNALRDSGIDDAQREAASNEFRDGIISGFDEEGKFVTDSGVARYFDEQTANLNSKIEELTGFTPLKGAGDSLLGGMLLNPLSGGNNFVGDNNVTQREVIEAQANAEAMYLGLVEITGDEIEARKLTLALLDEGNEIARVYNHVLDETKDMGASLNASLSAMQQGGGMFGNNKEMMDSYATGFVGKSNAQNYAKLFQDGQTLEQQRNQLRFSSENATFFNDNAGGPAGERVEAIGGGFNREEDGKRLYTDEQADMFRDQYANAMGSIADLIGPELQDKLTPFVAAGIEAGMVDGGTEGLTELDRLLGGDAEAMAKYVDVDLADGSLNDMQDMVDAIKYIKTIPPDIRVQFGIDILNPDHMKMLEDKAMVDRLISIGKMMESLPEEERSFASKFAFDIEDPDGQPIATSEFLNGWRDIRQELADLDGASPEVTMTAIIKILTKVNGTEVTPEQAEESMERLVEKYGADTIENLPPITKTTVLNLDINTEESVRKLKALRQATLAMGGGDVSALNAQIIALQAAGDNEVAEAISPNAFNGSPSDPNGGGSGSDKDLNYLEQLEEDFGKRTDIMENMKKLAKFNNKIAKDVNKLDRETMMLIAADEEAMADIRDGKYSGKKIKDMVFGQMSMDEDEQTKGIRKSKATKEDVESHKKLGHFTKQQILADEQLLKLYEQGGRFRKDAIEDAKKRAKIETTLLDRQEHEVDMLRKINDLTKQSLDLSIKKKESSAEDGVFAGTGRDRASIDQDQKEIAAKIKLAQLSVLDPMKEKVEVQKKLIKEMEREFVINEDNIDDAKEKLDVQKRILEDMQRALEIRQREGAVLTHDLKLMGYMEEDINEAYDKRMEALNKTLTINQQIAQSQQQQLGLASALSRGDVSAAASAAQQMQQGAMENAANQFKSQLETSKQSQIDSLTGAESGMTKDQITDRQRQLEEDSYYTNLQMRDVQDEIFRINRGIRDEQDIIDGYKDSIKENNKTIRDLEWDIYLAEDAQLGVLKKEQTANNLLLAQADHAVTMAGREDKIELARFNRNAAMWDQEQKFAIAKIKLEKELNNQMRNNFNVLTQMTKMANEYHKAIKSGNGNTGIKLAGKTGMKLSVAHELVNFDGLTAELGKMKSGYENATASFNLPSASVGAKATSGIMGNVTNNNMNNNVNVNAQGASAVEVADIVIRKLALEKLTAIGGAG